MSESTPQYCRNFGAKKEMTDSTFILEARRIGITETDVMASKNIIQLLNWQIEVSKDIAAITGQIEKQAALFHSEGNQGNPVHYANQKQAKRLLELLVQRINVRVQELKHDSIVQKNQFAERFMEAARRILDAEVFYNLIHEAE